MQIETIKELAQLLCDQLAFDATSIQHRNGKTSIEETKNAETKIRIADLLHQITQIRDDQ